MARRYKAPRQPDAVVLSGAPVNRPPRYAGNKALASVVRYSVIETRRQEEVIEGLLMMGASDRQIQAQVCRPDGSAPNALGVGTRRVSVICERIRARWDSEDQTQRAARKSAQLRRLMNNIQRCRSKLMDANLSERSHRGYESALHRWESLYADVGGTLAPIDVNINVHVQETLVEVFSSYSLERLQQLHEEAEREHELALAYQQEHPELARTIVTNGASVE